MYKTVDCNQKQGILYTQKNLIPNQGSVPWSTVDRPPNGGLHNADESRIQIFVIVDQSCY